MEQRGRAKGGFARAESLTPEQRQEIARYAAAKRWEASSGLPKETHAGVLPLGGMNLACGVLDNDTRVLSTRGITRAFGGRRTGTSAGDSSKRAPELPSFLGSEAIRPFISEELFARLITPIEYRPLRGGRSAFGYEARLLPDICRVILEARKAKKLRHNQAKYADAAEIMLHGLADVGIIALVDEATGYQYDRAKDDLMKILEAYVSKALLPWTERFPSTFFKEIYRLHGWEFREGRTQGPRVVGKLINKLIFEQLPPGVLEDLRRKNPPAYPSGYRRHKHHQWLTQDIGIPHLTNQVSQVMGIMRASENKHEFSRLFDRAFPKKGQQGQLAFPAPNDDD
jgi:hypothetical protein